MAVVHPQGPDVSATAAALLAAAQELDLPATIVAATSSAEYGTGFIVPDEVAEQFHKHMTSSVHPIRVDIESVAQVAEQVTEEPDDSADEPSKPTPVKRGPRKAVPKEQE